MHATCRWFSDFAGLISLESFDTRRGKGEEGRGEREEGKSGRGETSEDEDEED